MRSKTSCLSEAEQPHLCIMVVMPLSCWICNGWPVMTYRDDFLCLEGRRASLYSMGVFDCTVPLHHVFHAPASKILWDVGRQYLLQRQFSHCQLSPLIATMVHFSSMYAMKDTILEYIQTIRAP